MRQPQNTCLRLTGAGVSLAIILKLLMPSTAVDESLGTMLANAADNAACVAEGMGSDVQYNSDSPPLSAVARHSQKFGGRIGSTAHSSSGVSEIAMSDLAKEKVQAAAMAQIASRYSDEDENEEEEEGSQRRILPRNKDYIPVQNDAV